MTDIHKQNASKIFRKPYEEVTDYERDAAKAAIHYFNYGPSEFDPWKHRSKGMRCNTCMFFVKQVTTESSMAKSLDIPDATIGRCRRHAPTMSGYPAVFSNDWCGDHKLDENKI